MKTSTRPGALRRDLPLTLAFALGALSLACMSARAANLDPVTITPPAVKVVGQDWMTGAPIEQTTVTAVVRFKPVTLTTRSGVSLLEDRVRNAAARACEATAPFSLNDERCVNRAVQSARPEVAAAITRARSTPKG